MNIPKAGAACLQAALLLAAQAVSAAGSATPLEAPRQSWLLDHTHSPLGAQFFRAFAGTWREEERGAVVISVEEERGPGLAHQVRIRAGDRLLLQAHLHPGLRGRVDSLGQAAALAAAERLRQWPLASGGTP